MADRNRLKDLRKNRFNDSFTQNEIANILGISKSQVYQRYEYDLSSISKNVIENASSFFKVSPQYFLDNSYGDIVCDAPHFKSYDYKKKKILFKELDKKNEKIIVNKDCFITDFFIVDLDEEMLSRRQVGKIIRSYHRTQKRPLAARKLSFYDAAKIINLDEIESEVKILMMKTNVDNLKNDVFPNFYLIMNQKNKDLILAYIKKNKNKYEITYVFDFNKNLILYECPYPTKDISFELTASNSTLQKIEEVDISELEIIGKAVFFWDPKDSFPFFVGNLIPVRKTKVKEVFKEIESK